MFLHWYECLVKIVGDSTGEDSTLDEIDLMQELKEMTLSWILAKIFSDTLFESIRYNFLELLFEESEDIINNEIMVWTTTFEKMYPLIAKKVIFLKPDYNKAYFYSLQYKYESFIVTIDEIWDYLKPELSKEHQFLIGVSKTLTVLLNNHGKLESIISGYNEQLPGKSSNLYLIPFSRLSCCVWINNSFHL